MVGIELPVIRTRQTETGCDEVIYNLLDSELPTLIRSSQQGPNTKQMRDPNLTARTRSRDDFPAFCRPIMVTSISVALHTVSSFHMGNGPWSPTNCYCAAHLPEHP